MDNLQDVLSTTSKAETIKISIYIHEFFKKKPMLKNNIKLKGKRKNWKNIYYTHWGWGWVNNCNT